MNTLILRDQLDINESFDKFLKNVNKTVIEGLENQDYPFENIIEKVEITRSYGKFPMIPVFLNMLDFNTTESKSIVDFTSKVEVGQVGAKFDLECYFKSYANGLSITCSYDQCLFSQETISYWINGYVSIIEQVVNNFTIVINDIKIFQEIIA